MEWISVEDRLPELRDDNFSDMVLVTIEGGSMYVAWLDNEVRELGWSSDNDLREPPTHWMPLPEPPKGEIK